MEKHCNGNVSQNILLDIHWKLVVKKLAFLNLFKTNIKIKQLKRFSACSVLPIL
jgi:hypothetical protein